MGIGSNVMGMTMGYWVWAIRKNDDKRYWA